MESTYGLYSYYGVVYSYYGVVNSGSEDTFREAVSFSLSRLGLSDVCLKEGQHGAVYEGQDVFVSLMVRANPAIPNGAQTEWK